MQSLTLHCVSQHGVDYAPCYSAWVLLYAVLGIGSIHEIKNFKKSRYTAHLSQIKLLFSAV